MRAQIQNWLLHKSIETWNAIGKVRKSPGLRLTETTITENLILNFSELAKNYPFEVYVSKDERANGNDLEIFVELDKGYILFPTQCKMIKAASRYDGMPYKANNSPIGQLDLLVLYAQKIKGIPLYLFYNNSNDLEDITRIRQSYEYMFDYGFQVESLGMSIGIAQEIKSKYFAELTQKWTIPKFLDLHLSVALPFCQIVNLNSRFIAKIKTYKNSGRAKLYSLEEIYSHRGWGKSDESASIGSIGYITGLPKEFDTLFNPSTKNSVNNSQFNPKYRVIISNELTSKLFDVE